jgi:hypothetical protein
MVGTAMVYEVEKILARRRRKLPRGGTKDIFLVKWKGYPNY